MPSPQPAWYADPQDGSRIRWWDGAAWTRHVKAHPATLREPERAPTPEPAMAMAMASTAPADTAPAVVDLGGAPSIGAARLPPLPPPPARVEADGHPSGRARPSNPMRSLLRAVIVIAILVAVAVGVYASGVVDTLIGGGDTSAREPSSAAVSVYNGDGYSFEVPIAWSRVEDTGTDLRNGPAVAKTSKFEFQSPEGERLLVVTAPVTRGVGPATLQADSALKAAFSDNPVQLQGPTPVDIAGMSAQQYDLSESQNGEPVVEGSVTALASGDRMVIVALLGAPAQFDSPVAVLERQLLLESFRLD